MVFWLHTKIGEHTGQSVITAKCTCCWINQLFTRNIQSARNMSWTSMATYQLTCILPAFTRINHRDTLLIKERQDILRRGTQLWLRYSRKSSWWIGRNVRYERPILSLPFRQAPIQYDNLIVTVVVEGPPEPRSKLRGRMRIIGDNQVLIANTQTSHQAGKAFGR